jgi:hypothetical protein
MKKYRKVLFSLFLGGLCIFIGLTMETENKWIIYFLYLVGIVNIYIGIKDFLAIFKTTK